MRILHVVNSLEMGGMERMLLLLIQQQCSHGHQCHVVCIKTKGALSVELTRIGVEVCVVYKKAGVDVRSMIRLRKMVKAFQPDVIHSHNVPASIYSLLLLTSRKYKRIHTLHNIRINQLPFAPKLLYRSSLQLTDKIVLVCESAKDDFIQATGISNEKVFVIPNGISVHQFIRNNNNISYDLNSPRVIIGAIGRLEPIKNHQLLIRAFKLSSVKFDNAELHIVGSGSQLSVLKDLASTLGISERVKFHGEQSDVLPFYHMFNMFVLPSYSEGYSMSLIEACASGLAIIATDVGGNSEIIDDSCNGLLVVSDSVEQMSKAIEQLLVDPEAMRRFSENARSWARCNADSLVMYERYDHLYRR